MRSTNPRIMFRGVRNSWLTLATNAALVFSASSAIVRSAAILSPANASCRLACDKSVSACSNSALRSRASSSTLSARR